MSFKAVDLMNKGLSLISLGREKQWNKWGKDRLLPVLDMHNIDILQEEVDETYVEVKNNNKTNLLFELIDVASFAGAWIEAIVEELEYRGYSFREIQNMVENEFRTIKPNNNGGRSNSQTIINNGMDIGTLILPADDE